LEYEWHGPPPNEAATIVFLHEGLGAISRWRDFPAALCGRLGCGALVYNRRGYGRSDPLDPPLSPGFMHHEALEVLPRLLEIFDAHRPGLAPPTALVLEAPHVFVEDLTVASIAEVRNSYRSSELRARLGRHHGSNVDLLFDSWTDVWLSDEFRDWNIEEYLPRITCPTLVIQGRDDEYGTVKQVDAIRAGVSGTIEALLLDACGHSPHIDRREAVEAASVKFLERLVQ
jgi:pimeloyl-ACP methyl ester carboxylesterase